MALSDIDPANPPAWFPRDGRTAEQVAADLRTLEAVRARARARGEVRADLARAAGAAEIKRASEREGAPRAYLTDGQPGSEPCPVCGARPYDTGRRVAIDHDGDAHDRALAAARRDSSASASYSPDLRRPRRVGDDDE